MKLQEALKQAIVQFSASILGEKRLVYLISDRQGFDDFPAMKQVFDTIVSGNSGKELSSLAIGGKKDEFIRYADGLRKSLVSSQHFKQGFADFAADSLIFALIHLIAKARQSLPADTSSMAARASSSWSL